MNGNLEKICEAIEIILKEIAENNIGIANYLRDNLVIDEKTQTLRYTGDRAELVKVMVEGMFKQ